MRSVQKASSHVLWKIEIFIGEDTRSTVHRTMTPQAPSITISCPIIFTQISLVVWNLFPFKGDFSFGKSQKSQGTKPGLYGGWVTWVIWYFTKNSAQGVVHERAHMLPRRSCWSPFAHSSDCLNHPNSFRGGMVKLITKFDADLLLCSLSHFECDSHSVHMLTQLHLLSPLTSTVKSSLFTHVHSSLLFLAARLHRCANHSHYINNGWTFSG